MQEAADRKPTVVVVLLLAVAALQATAWAGCKPQCAGVSSVVHAAGVPPALAQALQRLSFKGNTLAAGDAEVVKDIVRVLAALPAGTQVSLSTRADPGAAAKQQAQARAKALEQAVRASLQAAGAKGGVLKGIAAQP